MSAWTYTTPPTWAPTAVSAQMGWAHATTGELLVAISNFTAKNTDAAAAPTVVGATLLAGPTFVTDDVFTVVVEFSEAVVVTGAPTIALTLNATPATLTYDESLSDTTHVAFSYTVLETDVYTAGQVTVGSEIVVTAGAISDILPGGGTIALAGPIAITPPDTALVTFN